VKCLDVLDSTRTGLIFTGLQEVGQRHAGSGGGELGSGNSHAGQRELTRGHSSPCRIADENGKKQAETGGSG